MATELLTVDLSQEFQNAWNSHDVLKILLYFTEKCLYEEGALGVATHGKQELKSYLEILVHDFPDFTIVMQNYFSNSGRAAYEGTWSGTFANNSMPGMPPATGKKVTMPFAAIIEMNNGKINRHSSYWDLVSFLKQTGLMPG